MPPRFYVPAPLAAGLTLALPDNAARHLKVLRVRADEAITLFDGRGGEFRATVVEIGKRDVLVTVGAADPREAELPYHVTLAQGLAGGDKMDWLIEKAVELGVTAIQPLATETAVVRLDAERAARRQAHWQALVESACEQCGRNRAPEVAMPARLSDWLAQPRADDSLDLVLSPRATQPLTALLHARTPSRIRLLIGPEGGLTETEEKSALAAGFIAAGLGPRILRTETAGIAALSALAALWGGF